MAEKDGIQVAERRIAIIGAGMVGRSLALALTARGANVVAIASRHHASAQHAAREAGIPEAPASPAEAARQANLVVLAVPDAAIAPVCQQIADQGGFEPGDVAMHLSGACTSDALAAARRAGAAALAFHPIQTFARPDPDLFDGITCAVQGDPHAVDLALALARFLGAAGVPVRPQDKPLYHAALAIACNYAVTLADAGAELLRDTGFGDRALHALLPLLRGTVENLARTGLPDALTGPIARGDIETVRSHLTALETHAPHLLPVYRSLGIQTAALARRKGTLSGDAERELLRLLQAED
jgi:predicted short-subunit dehydrogenase-like oxidoreductase (DUF2520 family)